MGGRNKSGYNIGIYGDVAMKPFEKLTYIIGF
jgi:hypothetical protein